MGSDAESSAQGETGVSSVILNVAEVHKADGETPLPIAHEGSSLGSDTEWSDIED